MNKKSIAIMQPYFFPYIGYFQLFNKVDHFIFYDDVNYIKKGWINRNNFLINGKEKSLTLPVKKASQNELIKNIFIATSKDSKKLLKSIEFSYKKAPYYEKIFQIFEMVINSANSNTPISELAALSVKTIGDYLNIRTKTSFSSKEFSNSKGLDKADRLITICKQSGIDNYINSYNGINLYQKDYFLRKGINLSFLKSSSIDYKQFGKNFCSNLSMIDVLMFNSKDKCREYLGKYEIV